MNIVYRTSIFSIVKEKGGALLFIEQPRPVCVGGAGVGGVCSRIYARAADPGDSTYCITSQLESLAKEVSVIKSRTRATVAT